MRHLFPLIIGIFLVASLLIYLLGDSGLLAYGDLESHRQRLAANVESLQQRNKNLSAELAGLKESDEQNILLARRIGLYRPGEEVVKLEGFAPRVEHYVVGDLLKLRKTSEAKSPMFKAGAICLAVFLSVLALFFPRASRRRVRGSHGGQL
jgi:cell division protein FtsB